VSTATIFHCYCTGVTQKRVLRAMAETGARELDDVRRASGACTGCQSCRCELEALLEAVADGTVALAPASASTSTT
jgi:bacterioferritin-associated ferredoxin